MQLIGLAGPAGVGKDSVADYLVETHGFQKFSFSDALYREVATAFNVPIEDLYNRDLKEQAHDGLKLNRCTDPKFINIAICALDEESRARTGEYYLLPENIPLSPRWVLQRWGTTYRREQDPDYWVKRADAFVVEFIESLVEERDDLGNPIRWSGHPGLVNTSVRFLNESRWLRETNGTVWHILRPGYPVSADNNFESEYGVPVRTGDRVLLNRGNLASLGTTVSLMLQGNHVGVVGDNDEWVLAALPRDAGALMQARSAVKTYLTQKASQ